MTFEESKPIPKTENAQIKLDNTPTPTSSFIQIKSDTPNTIIQISSGNPISVTTNNPIQVNSNSDTPNNPSTSQNLIMPSNSFSAISPVSNTSPERLKNDLQIVTKVLDFESLPAEKKSNLHLTNQVKTNSSEKKVNIKSILKNNSPKKVIASDENINLDLSDAEKNQKLTK